MSCKLVEEVTGYTITIQQFQWGYRQGTEYMQRVWGETGAGVQWRERIPDRNRTHMSITFDGSRDMAEQLRTLTYKVMQYGGRVLFYPNVEQEPERAFWVDWQETLDNAYQADWRHEITLDLIGSLDPVPRWTEMIAQALIEAMVRPGAAYDSSVVVEVLVMGFQAYVSQALLEVPVRYASAYDASVVAEAAVRPQVVYDAGVSVEAMVRGQVAYAASVVVEVLVAS